MAPCVDRKSIASWLARALGSNHRAVDTSSCWRKDVHVKPKYMCFMNSSRLRTLPSHMTARTSGMISYYTLSLRCLTPSMGSESRYLAFHSFLSLSELYGIIESSIGLSDKKGHRPDGPSVLSGWQLCQEPLDVHGATCVKLAQGWLLH